VVFVLIWVFTVPVMWPMNHELYLASQGLSRRSDAEIAQMARRWVTYDWLRVGMLAVSFLSSVRSISIPLPR